MKVGTVAKRFSRLKYRAVARNRGHGRLVGIMVLSDSAKVCQDSQDSPVVLWLRPQLKLQENTPDMGFYGALP